MAIGLAEPRFPYQLLSLFLADLGPLLSADDHPAQDEAKNGHLPTIFVWAGNGMLALWGAWRCCGG